MSESFAQLPGTYYKMTKMSFPVIAGALFFMTLWSEAVFAGTWLDTVLVSLHSKPLPLSSSDSQTILAELRGHIFPLVVNSYESYTSFEIEGRDQVCFDFKVELSPEGKKGYVSWINTEVPGCPLPPDHKGTFLLDLVDLISKEAGIAEVKLEDESKVRCKLNGEPTDLAFLRILQKGQSWYGSHDYFPEENRSEYDESLIKLSNFPLSQFQQEFPELRDEVVKYASNHPRNAQARWTAQNFNNRFGDLGEWLSDFESDQGKGRHLNDFLSWVWEEDCTAFNPIASLIFPKAEWSFINRFDWISSLRTIQKNGIYLIKRFH